MFGFKEWKTYIRMSQVVEIKSGVLLTFRKEQKENLDLKAYLWGFSPHISIGSSQNSQHTLLLNLNTFLGFLYKRRRDLEKL